MTINMLHFYNKNYLRYNEYTEWGEGLDQQIDELIKQLSPHIRGSLRGCLECHEVCLVCDNSLLIAMSRLLVYPRFNKLVGQIEDVVVDKEYRGEGLGKRMISDLIENAKNAGCYKVILWCEPHNEGFYEKSGFTKSESLMRLDLEEK